MKSRKKALILGSSGMLARAILRTLEDDPDYSAIAPPEHECDISNREALTRSIRTISPEVVLNCAAYTDVDGCERDPEKAHIINAVGAGNVAAVCRETGSLLVHVSTDFVFNGNSHRPYSEDDEPDPISVYGKSKLAGERAVKETIPRHLLIRTAWTFGPGRENFVTKILDRAAREPKLDVVADQIGSPTYTSDLSSAIMALVKAGKVGLFHVVNAGWCSRSEFARAILAESGIHNVEIRDVRSIAAPGVASRPAMSALDTEAYKKATGRKLRPWEEALIAFLREFNR